MFKYILGRIGAMLLTLFLVISAVSYRYRRLSKCFRISALSGIRFFTPCIRALLVACSAFTLRLIICSICFSVGLCSFLLLCFRILFLTVGLCFCSLRRTVFVYGSIFRLCLRLLIVYIAYFSWGSAEARQRERAQQLSTLSSSIPYKA